MQAFFLFTPVILALCLRRIRFVDLYMFFGKHTVYVLLIMIFLISALFITNFLPIPSSSDFFSWFTPLVKDFLLPLVSLVAVLLFFPQYNRSTISVYVLFLVILYAAIQGPQMMQPIYHYFMRPLIWIICYLLVLYFPQRSAFFSYLGNTVLLLLGTIVFSYSAFYMDRSKYAISFGLVLLFVALCLLPWILWNEKNAK